MKWEHTMSPYCTYRQGDEPVGQDWRSSGRNHRGRRRRGRKRRTCEDKQARRQPASRLLRWERRDRVVYAAWANCYTCRIIGAAELGRSPRHGAALIILWLCVADWFGVRAPWAVGRQRRIDPDGTTGHRFQFRHASASVSSSRFLLRFVVCACATGSPAGPRLSIYTFLAPFSHGIALDERTIWITRK